MGNSKMKKFFATMMIAAMLCPSMVYADTLEEIPVEANSISVDPEDYGTNEENVEPDSAREVDFAGLGVGKISNPSAPDENGWNGSYVYYGNSTVSSPDTYVRYRVLDKKVLYPDHFGGVLLDCDYGLKKGISWTDGNAWIGDNWTGAGESFKNTLTPNEVAAIFINTIGLPSHYTILQPTYGYTSSKTSSTSRVKKFITGENICWWLSDTYNNENDKRYYVAYDGTGGNDSDVTSDNRTTDPNDDYPMAISPEFILDPSSIIYATKVSGTMGQVGAEYKLTVLDSGIVATVDGELTRKGNVVTVPCTIPDGTSASVVVTDRPPKVNNGVWNGWGDIPDNTKGDHYKVLDANNAFTLPEEYKNLTWGTDYHVYLFAEDINGIKETDYASKPVELSAPKQVYNVKVEVSGNGTVSKKLNGTAVTQLKEAAAGDQVELTATPKNSNNQFKEWDVKKGVELSGEQKKNPTLKFTMSSSDVEVKAVFEEKSTPVTTTYTITALNDGNGTATANPSKAGAGKEVTLTATPKNSNYRFKAWVINAGGITFDKTKNPVTFKVGNSNVEVKATFERKTTPSSAHTITMLATSKKGKASASEKSAVKGKTVNIAATSKKGYTFKEWRVISGGVKLKNAKSAKTSFTMGDKNVKIKAYFYKASFKLNTSKLVVEKGKKNSRVKATLKNDKLKSAVSSNKNVATAKIVGKKVQITGKKAGKAKITVKTKSGLSRKFNVTVQADKVTTTKLKLSKTKVSVGKNKYKTVKVTATPNYFSTGENIKVKSSDKKIAKCTFNKTTNKIKITGKKKGNCEITVTAGKKTKTITVTVK